METNTTEESVKKTKNKRRNKNHKSVQPKTISTPFELFGDEGLSKTGWAGLLIPLYEEVENQNKSEVDNKFVFSQIKEKYGELCLYNFGATQELSKQIDMCEKASNHICMNCGSVFKVGKTEDGWITTLCEECAKKEGKIGNDFVFVYNDITQKDSHAIRILAKDKIDAFTKLCEYVENIVISQNTDNRSADTAYNTYEEIDRDKLKFNVKRHYKFVRKYRYVGWHLQYDSIRITKIIKIALELQKFGFYCTKIVDKILHKFWLFRGYIRFLFTHYILKNSKLDNTIFNRKKFKPKK